MATEEQKVHRLTQRVYKLEKQIEFLYQHLNTTFPEEALLEEDPRILAALRARNKADAIDYYQEAHPVGLVDAINAVNQIAAKYGIK
jgi:hypothetical protein